MIPCGGPKNERPTSSTPKMALCQAVADELITMVPSALPDGWTTAGGGYRAKPQWWHMEYTAPSGDVTLDQFPGDTDTVLADQPDLASSGDVDLSAWGIGTWSAWDNDGATVLTHELKGSTVILQGADQDTVTELAKSLMTHWAGRTVLLILDETPRANDLRAMCVRAAYAHRAVPLAWVCYRPDEPPQPLPRLVRSLLRQVRGCLPAGCRVVLLADRGLAWPVLIDFCQESGWHYVLRLQHHIKVRLPDGTERAAGELAPRAGTRWYGGAEFFQGYPSLTADAARWIASRGIGLLGMDTPSPSEDYVETHLALLGAGIIIVEALANLEGLPARFTLSCLPLKLAPLKSSSAAAPGWRAQNAQPKLPSAQLPPTAGRAGSTW